MPSNPVHLDNLLEDARQALEKYVVNASPRMVMRKIRKAAWRYAGDVVKERPVEGLLQENPDLYGRILPASVEGMSIASAVQHAASIVIVERLEKPMLHLRDLTYHNRYLQYLCDAYYEALAICDEVGTKFNRTLVHVPEMREFITDFREGDGQDILSIRNDLDCLRSALEGANMRDVMEISQDKALDERVASCLAELVDLIEFINIETDHFKQQVDINRVTEQHKKSI
jgi:hypothetical protein